ncbi:MAG TPA: cytochrome c3 family protein [Gemmatimonadaceae bacterium]|nr:cytochrome c3 family protein [Gemmatimonadaceae bacterium]
MRTLRTQVSRRSSLARAFFALVLGVSVLGGCQDDRIVYRDRAPFNQPADATSGFLGYYDVSTRQTTCGNCHADIQSSWVGTKHASASAKMEASTTKDSTCYNCHSLNGNGNAANGTKVGYLAVAHNTYRDVQCESCHGAGLTHVEGVGQATLVRPLAKLTATGTATCRDCHSGAHQPFAEEWSQSGHANVNTSRASNSVCWGCHDGRKAIARWGVTDNYVERDSATAYQATTCAVCHAPHGSANTAQLRFPITTPDPDQNLCMQCHMRRFEPEVASSSPHAPQGAVLMGFAGYRPPGFVYDTSAIYGSHATSLNPRLCAGCHVNRYTVTDKLTGAFTFQSTGHLMRPIPCLDATGKPTADKTCAYTTTARTFKACAQAGCHASEAVAQTLFTTVRARMKFLADQLWTDNGTAGTLSATPTDGGLLATLKATKPAEWSTTDNQITPAEGAEFNARLCGEYGQANSDNSKGVHNPFLCEALLTATITYIRSYYNLPAASKGEQAALGNTLTEELRASLHVKRTSPRH